MPLINSSSAHAFASNVAKETEAKKAAGYSPKKAAQIATAIAYRIQRTRKSKS